MPYYHTYIKYRDQKGELSSDILYNFSEEEVKKAFALPYMKSEAILVLGKFVRHSDIDTLNIFASKKPFHELTLPDKTSPVDANLDYTNRCFLGQKVKNLWLCTHDFITSPPKERKELILMKSASFLGLDTNWSFATCALQLQEVAVTLVAKKSRIKLNKANVERILNKKIANLSFGDQYRAFTREVRTSSGIELPILTTHLRKMRVKVLHEGYNPKPEETDSIIGFTIGLLQRLNEVSRKT